ncbi:ABC-2 type transport system permease protein [Methanomicrobium sp. W14]|uniref:ABC transporter permease n=1 Tax=Methanomicrobium sp. W14 TaxID=2817839 RepID=UPI001AE58A68|nr:ABC-2 type transport system permease protein [Methanomicrobium sp. W14]
MDFHRLKVISQKEFSDHIKSRRFLFLLVIFCLVLGIEATSGVSSYNTALENYKNGDSMEIYQPSAVEVFSDIVNSVGGNGLGVIIGLALGFDLISGEREKRSLKTILSRPVYRDELINGKALGGLFAIAIITLISFIVVFSVMLIMGIVPDLDGIAGIGIIWVLTFLFISAFFSLSLMTSVIANTNSGSLLLSLVIIFILLLIIPIGGGEIVSHLLLGQPPQEPPFGSVSDSQYSEYLEQSDEYHKGIEAVNDFFDDFSMKSVYNDISIPITSPSNYVMGKVGFSAFCSDPDIADSIEKPDFWTVIEDKWIKIIVFLMWPVLFFGIAYVKFMRSDLR